MRPWLVLGAAALLLAGCVGSPVQTASVPPAALAAANGSIASLSTVIDEKGGTGEPSFGVAPNGHLFANGNGGKGGGTYGSTDGGATWTLVGTPDDPMPNFDPDISVDQDGTIWFDGLWIGCTAVATSKDEGKTWSSNPAACNTAVADRQYVIPTKGGEAFLYSHQTPSNWQMAAKTVDYGKSWTPTGLVEPVTNNPALNNSGWGGGGFYNAKTGSVFFTWSWFSGVTTTSAAPGFAVTRDDGKSFEVGAIHSPGGAPLGLGLVTGAADAAGNVYLTWGETKDKGVAIYMSASKDDGKTWTPAIRVDDSTGSKVFPILTAGPAGKVAIAYYEAKDEAYPSNVQGDWNVTLAWTNDALSAAPTFQHGTLSKGPVKHGGICIDGTVCQKDREFDDYFQAHRLPDGRVGAVYNSMLDVKDQVVEVYSVTKDPVLG